MNRIVHHIIIPSMIFALNAPLYGATSQPYSPVSKAPVQAEQSPAAAQPAPAAAPYAVQPAPPPAAAPAQKLSPAAPYAKQPTQPAAPAVQQKKVEEAKLVSVQRSAPQWISWPYLRAYQPETLGRMLGDVNSGKIPRTAVSGVVPPAQLDLLLKDAALAPNVVAATQGLPPTATGQKFNPRAEVKALNRDVISAAKGAPSSSVAWVPALRSLPFQTNPDRLEFGTLMLGQAQYKTVRFMAPANGEVRVSISDPAFQIRRMRSLNGTFSLQTVPVALATGATIQSVHAVPNATQQRTAAPWSLAVRSGEDVEILVDISRHPSTPMGEHTAQLRVDLTNTLGATVPVHARLDGKLFGIGINVDGSLGVLPGRDFIVPFEWVNDGEPGEATISLENPPVGFSTPTPSQSIKLGKGERRQGAFLINVSNAVQKPNYDFATLNIKLTNGPVRLNYGIDVLIYPLWLMRSVVGRTRFSDGEEVAVSGMMQIRSDGWFQFSGKINAVSVSGASAKVYQYEVGIHLPGGFGHTVYGSSGRFALDNPFPNLQQSWSETGMDPRLANNFMAAAKGLSQAALNPYIKVTKSLL